MRRRCNIMAASNYSLVHGVTDGWHVTHGWQMYDVIGGIGVDGHIAFNEPGSALTSRTRIKTLAYETIVSNARFFNNSLSQVPKMALTVRVLIYHFPSNIVLISGMMTIQ